MSKKTTKVAKATKPTTVTVNSVKDQIKKKVKALARDSSGKNLKELRVDSNGRLVIYRNRKVTFKTTKVTEAVQKFNGLK